MEKDPSALEEMYRLGYRMVPVAVAEGPDGVEVVVGFNPKELTRVFSLPPTDLKISSKDDLELFDQILLAAVRAVRQIPDDQLDGKSPDRQRQIREFVYHIFGNPSIYLDAFMTGKMAWESIEQTAERAKAFQGAADIADFGERTRGRLKDWARDAKEEIFDRPVKTYMSGTMTVGNLLEKIRGHSAHHLRQLYVFLRSIGIEPEDPLTDKDFDRLGLPPFIY